MLPTVQGEFRVAAEPSLRFSPGGMAVGSFRAVASSRKKTDDGEWVDDKTCWVTVTGFRKIAENMAESLEKGDLVVVVGKLQTEDWEDKEGVKRTSMNIIADFVGPALTFIPAKPMRTERSSGGQSGGQSSGSRTQDEDPWATAPSSSGGQAEEPPF